MKLITKEIIKTLPPLYAQEDKGEDAIVHIKFFSPVNPWTWYVTEFDPNDNIFFGLVIGDTNEFGYFSLKELEEISLPFGLKIERDLYFEKSTIRECQHLHVKQEIN